MLLLFMLLLFILFSLVLLLTRHTRTAPPRPAGAAPLAPATFNFAPVPVPLADDLHDPVRRRLGMCICVF